jgi:hypothetical protein
MSYNSDRLFLGKRIEKIMHVLDKCLDPWGVIGGLGGERTRAEPVSVKRDNTMGSRDS